MSLSSKIIFERRAYHQQRTPPVEIFKATYNQALAREVKDLLYRLSNKDNMRKFDDVVAFGGILCEKKGGGECCLKQVFH